VPLRAPEYDRRPYLAYLDDTIDENRATAR